MESDFWEEVSYVQSSKNREKALRLLVEAGRPMTPTELADRMDVVVKSSSRSVRQLADHDLVECVNPEAPRDRRYRPTKKGRNVWSGVKDVEEREGGGKGAELAEPGLEYAVEEVPEELREDVSYLRMSKNRKAVMGELSSSGIPLTPSELAEELDLDFNSASRAVRQLAERGLARCVNPGSEKHRRYELTEHGERIYRVLKGEL